MSYTQLQQPLIRKKSLNQQNHWNHTPRTPSRLSKSNFTSLDLKNDLTIDLENSQSASSHYQNFDISNNSNSHASDDRTLLEIHPSQLNNRAQDLNNQWQSLFNINTFQSSSAASSQSPASLLNSNPLTVPNLDQVYSDLLSALGEDDESSEQEENDENKLYFELDNSEMDNLFSQLDCLLQDLDPSIGFSPDSQPLNQNSESSLFSKSSIASSSNHQNLPLYSEFSKFNFPQSSINNSNHSIPRSNSSYEISSLHHQNDRKSSFDSSSLPPPLSPSISGRSSYSYHSRQSSATTSVFEPMTPTSISESRSNGSTYKQKNSLKDVDWENFVGKILQSSKQDSQLLVKSHKHTQNLDRAFSISSTRQESIMESPLEEEEGFSSIPFVQRIDDDGNVYSSSNSTIPYRTLSVQSRTSTRSQPTCTCSKQQVENTRSPSAASQLSNLSSASLVLPRIPSRNSSLSESATSGNSRKSSFSTATSPVKLSNLSKENKSPSRPGTPDLFKQFVKQLPSRGRIPLFASKS